MGYYTNYDFSSNSKEVQDEIVDVSGYNNEGGCFYGVKWYTWHDHMIEISKRFPDQLIEIEGRGEESDDIWRAYFKNGKSQVCRSRIVFEEFDASKLTVKEI